MVSGWGYNPLGACGKRRNRLPALPLTKGLAFKGGYLHPSGLRTCNVLSALEMEALLRHCGRSFCRWGAFHYQCIFVRRVTGINCASARPEKAGQIRQPRGFYERAAILYHHARGTSSKQLVWIPGSGLLSKGAHNRIPTTRQRWRIDWARMNRMGQSEPVIRAGHSGFPVGI